MARTSGHRAACSRAPASVRCSPAGRPSAGGLRCTSPLSSSEPIARDTRARSSSSRTASTEGCSPGSCASHITTPHSRRVMPWLRSHRRVTRRPDAAASFTSRYSSRSPGCAGAASGLPAEGPDGSDGEEGAERAAGREGRVAMRECPHRG